MEWRRVGSAIITDWKQALGIPMRNDSIDRLREGLSAWDGWRRNAPRECDGWETLFEGCRSIVALASSIMDACDAQDEDVYPLIEEVWRLTEEDESMICDSRESAEACREWLIRLVESRRASVRWQAAVALARLGPASTPILERLAADHDAYARRRAMLELMEMSPEFRKRYIDRLAGDPDSYNRQVALNMRDLHKEI